MLRAAPRFWTCALTPTIAVPVEVSRVISIGHLMSLRPSRRTVTSRLMPPKLNHVRCQPVARCWSMCE